jgi:hypothetical protein
MVIGGTDRNIARQKEEAERIGLLCFYFLASLGALSRLWPIFFSDLDGTTGMPGDACMT